LCSGVRIDTGEALFVALVVERILLKLLPLPGGRVLVACGALRVGLGKAFSQARFDATKALLTALVVELILFIFLPGDRLLLRGLRRLWGVDTTFSEARIDTARAQPLSLSTSC
jgi:hypothetical protein